MHLYVRISLYRKVFQKHDNLFRMISSIYFYIFYIRIVNLQYYGGKNYHWVNKCIRNEQKNHIKKYFKNTSENEISIIKAGAKFILN